MAALDVSAMTAGAVIEVVGLPYPKGSMSATSRNGYAQLLDGSSSGARASLAAWQQAVGLAGKQWRAQHDAATFDGPVRVTVEFLFLATKSQPYRHHHTTKPDADKILRSTLDALVHACVLADDSLVCDAHASKRYCYPGQSPGCRIIIQSLAGVEELKRRERKRRAKEARLRVVAS